MENKIRQERKVKQIKAIGKAFVVAFSIYSKIPMPRFNWESDDMKYHLCFFTWVGAVIGGAAWLWSFLCMQRELGCEAFVFLGLAIPILITGGFHLDGFMDTCDALHSYQDREKKLEILKDPHIGAFAVICLAAYLLMAAGSLSIVASLGSEGLLPWEAGRVMGVLCMGFFLSRALSGISVVTMQGAKKKGMLQTFSDTAGKKTVLIILLIQMILCAAGMIWSAEIAMAMDVPIMAVISGEQSWSTERTRLLTTTSLRRSLGNKGLIGRSITRDVRIAFSEGLPSLLM